jgi:hypothetical protein
MNVPRRLKSCGGRCAKAVLLVATGLEKALAHISEYINQITVALPDGREFVGCFFALAYKMSAGTRKLSGGGHDTPLPPSG